MAKKIKAVPLLGSYERVGRLFQPDYGSDEEGGQKCGKTVREEIADTAPKKTGTYGKSWTVKKTGEDSKSLQVTVHSKTDTRSLISWSMDMQKGEVAG